MKKLLEYAEAGDIVVVWRVDRLGRSLIDVLNTVNLLRDRGIQVRSIMVALQSLQGTYSTLGPNVVITATLISSIPTVLLFIALRKYFMAGLQLGTK